MFKHVVTQVTRDGILIEFKVFLDDSVGLIFEKRLQSGILHRKYLYLKDLKRFTDEYLLSCITSGIREMRK